MGFFVSNFEMETLLYVDFFTDKIGPLIWVMTGISWLIFQKKLTKEFWACRRRKTFPQLIFAIISLVKYNFSSFLLDCQTFSRLNSNNDSKIRRIHFLKISCSLRVQVSERTQITLAFLFVAWHSLQNDNV